MNLQIVWGFGFKAGGFGDLFMTSGSARGALRPSAPTLFGSDQAWVLDLGFRDWVSGSMG